MNTNEELKQVIKLCRDIFTKKNGDYGAAWRIMRPSSITDQIYIKAQRIRTLQEKGVSMVGEGIVPEFIGIVNYGLMGVIQLREGYTDKPDMDTERVLAQYDEQMQATLNLMQAKNTDYDEAWRMMRVSSYVDLILMKIQRTKQIESHDGKTIISEGIDANYYDMVNYSLFALIKLVCEKDDQDCV